MKRLIVLLVACIGVGGVRGQDSLRESRQESFRTKELYNAYAVAKEMLKMERKFVSERLSPTAKDSLQTVLSALNWYADLQDEDVNSQSGTLRSKLQSYYRLDSLSRFLETKLYNLDFLDLSNMEDVKSFFSFKKDKKIDELYDKAEDRLCDLLIPYFVIRNSLAEEKKKSDDCLSEIKNATNYSSRLDSIINKLKDSFSMPNADSGKLKIAFDDSTKKRDNLNATVAEHNKKKDSIDSIISRRRNEEILKRNYLVKLLTDPNLSDTNLTKLLIASKGKHEDWNREMKTTEKELILNQSQFYQAKSNQIETVTQVSPSFRLPSEAEMIDAVAIYLAKRVKQESVMWFFETIKKNSKKYDLLSTFFPNTITLLQSNEVYEIPNLGAQWRYALSKDFVKMPRNVFTSEWFSTWYDSLRIHNSVNTRDFLIAAYDACDLLSQQYSYHQLVKQMHLNLQNNKDKDTSNKITPANIFAILYAFNQECVMPTVKKDSVRLMRYEDFRNATRDELEIMISLMDMKYANAFTPIWKASGASQFLNAKNAESFRRWAGRIESGIEQFNKVQADYLKLTRDVNDGKKVDAVYSVFNIWENVNGLINAIVPDTTIKDQNLKKIALDMKSTKQHMEAAFEVYHQLNLKNYAGAVNTTILLVERLIYSNNDSTDMNWSMMKKFDINDIDEKFKNKYFSNHVQPVKIDVLIKRSKRRSNELVIKKKADTAHHVFKVEKEISGSNDDLVYVTVENMKVKIVYGERVKVTEKMKKDAIVITTKNNIKLNADASFIIDTNNAQIATTWKYPDPIRFMQYDKISALVFEEDRQAINLIRKLAGFLNDVMLTTDAKQLSKVVESYALPPDSYKRKRNSWWSLDLNAHVGVYWGLEKLKEDKGGANSWAGVYGITAPIGLSISKTFGKRIKTDELLTEDQIRNPDKVRIAKRSVRKRTQSTLTFSINIVDIDIGAVVSYRFGGADSTAKGLPKDVNWAQVVSPGLRLAYGIPNTPLVLSGGYQYTPMLRKVQDNGVQKMDNTHRLSVGILFDLPLVNLWQRSYWRGKYSK